MPTERDPRVVLTEDKHFTLRPKPLERWIWEQKIPPAAERIFWVHWEEGMRRRDWCSELALSRVARLCCVDISTVTRSYQVLKRFGLIRREEPGRDAANPFQRAITMTEVRVPRDLLVTLSRSPNRRAARPLALEKGLPLPAQDILKPISAGEARHVEEPDLRLGRSEWRAVMAQFSAAERVEFFNASRDRRTAMQFDDGTALDPQGRAHVLVYLERLASKGPAEAVREAAVPRAPAAPARARKLSPMDAARVHRQVGQAVPASAAPEVFRQVLWSVEEGALRRFEAKHATNIALKKIREGAWSKPNRMPPNWMLGKARADTCSAA